MKLLNLKGIAFSLIIITLFSSFAFAQDGSTDSLAFFSQIIDFVKSYGGYSWGLKISGICMLIIASFKVSFLKPIWDKMGSFQIWAAPILGMIIGIFSMGTFSFAKLFAYLAAGMGAVYLHEILDLIKKIPGLGSGYVQGIDLLKSILKSPAK